MRPVNNITHRKQEKPYSCGAASVAMLFNAPESIIRKEVKTRVSGTSTDNVCDFLSKHGINHHRVHLHEDYYKFIDTLAQTSRKFPVYAVASFRDRHFAKGRDRNRNHAVLVSDGLIYDPACNKPMCPDEYESVFNKSLIFTSLIIIEDERPNFLKNSREFV